jgi:hypothetical protein
MDQGTQSVDDLRRTYRLKESTTKFLNHFISTKFRGNQTYAVLAKLLLASSDCLFQSWSRHASPHYDIQFSHRILELLQQTGNVSAPRLGRIMIQVIQF